MECKDIEFHALNVVSSFICQKSVPTLLWQDLSKTFTGVFIGVVCLKSF